MGMSVGIPLPADWMNCSSLFLKYFWLKILALWVFIHSFCPSDSKPWNTCTASSQSSPSLLCWCALPGPHPPPRPSVSYHRISWLWILSGSLMSVLLDNASQNRKTFFKIKVFKISRALEPLGLVCCSLLSGRLRFVASPVCHFLSSLAMTVPILSHSGIRHSCVVFRIYTPILEGRFY